MVKANKWICVVSLNDLVSKAPVEPAMQSVYLKCI